MKKKNQGFTLAELLIVVAVIAVLAAIAIPIFTNKLEHSREATDLANVRSAYAEVMDNAMLPDGGAPLSLTVSLKQRMNGWSTSRDVLDIGGITPDDTAHWLGFPHIGGSCTVKFDTALDAVMLYWGGDASYLQAAAPYQGQTLMALKGMENAERIKADQTTLEALGQEILDKNWTKDQLLAALGINTSSGTNVIRIADFYQMKSGSYSGSEGYESAGFKITGTESLNDILTGIGYDGGDQLDRTANSGKIQEAYDTTYTNPLFYSDELGANHFKSYAIDKTMRSIIIEDIKTDGKNGPITSFTIFSKAMDNNANLNNEEKALFRITVTK